MGMVSSELVPALFSSGSWQPLPDTDRCSPPPPLLASLPPPPLLPGQLCGAFTAVFYVAVGEERSVGLFLLSCRLLYSSGSKGTAYVPPSPLEVGVTHKAP